MPCHALPCHDHGVLLVYLCMVSLYACVWCTCTCVFSASAILVKKTLEKDRSECRCMAGVHIYILSGKDSWKKTEVDWHQIYSYNLCGVYQEQSYYEQCFAHAQEYWWYTMMPWHAIPCHVITYHAIPCHAISHHIMSDHATPSHTMPCHVTSYHVRPCHTKPHHAMPCHIISCQTMPHQASPYHAMSHHIISHHIMPYHIMLYHIMPCYITSHMTSNHIIPCNVMSHYLISYHDILWHGMSHHVISCHILSCHIMSHHAMPCHVARMHVHCSPTVCLWYILLVIAYGQALQCYGQTASTWLCYFDTKVGHGVCINHNIWINTD